MVLESFESLVVHLPAKGYGTTEFDMSNERRELLLAAGREAMEAYWDAHPVSFDTTPDPEAIKAQGLANKLAAKWLTP
jgi:hypothetical protein